MFFAKQFIGGLIDVVSNIDPGQFAPSNPPPPRRPVAYAEQHESDEEKQFRRVFQQLAGDDMEVSPTELMNILNKIIGKRGDLKTDGFSIESCRSMVAVMDSLHSGGNTSSVSALISPKEILLEIGGDHISHAVVIPSLLPDHTCRVNKSDSTGKLGFHEFKYLWDNIKKWQGVYKTFDEDRSGSIGPNELPKAFTAAGFPLNDQLFNMIIRRYSDESGNMDFDNYIGCLVRLDAMCRAFKTLDKDNNGTIKVNIKEWLQLTMYS